MFQQNVPPAQVRIVCSSEVAHTSIFKRWKSEDIIMKDELMLMDDLGLVGKHEVC